MTIYTLTIYRWNQIFYSYHLFLIFYPTLLILTKHREVQTSLFSLSTKPYMYKPMLYVIFLFYSNQIRGIFLTWKQEIETILKNKVYVSHRCKSPFKYRCDVFVNHGPPSLNTYNYITSMYKGQKCITVVPGYVIL